MAQWGWPPQQQQMFVRMQYDARRRAYSAAYPSADHSVIVTADGPIGSLIVARAAFEIRLVDIAFLSQHRGRGFGSRILTGLVEESIRLKLPLRLSVHRGNRAIHLYQRLGFVPIDSDDVYIEMERSPSAPTTP